MGWELLSALASVLKIFVDLFPVIKKVPPDQRAILFRRMKKLIVRREGVWIYWPLVSHWEQVTITPQALKLPKQQTVSADGITIEVDGTVEFNYIDEDEELITAIVRHADVNDLLTAQATHHICCLINQWDSKDLSRKRNTFNRELTIQIDEAFQKYGMRVVEATIESLAPANFTLLHLGDRQKANG
ncbi:MAG: SPFH domain-containing protein [bacterium]|nr:SPFH domain-containing protein [bacterium]